MDVILWSIKYSLLEIVKAVPAFIYKMTQQKEIVFKQIELNQKHHI